MELGPCTFRLRFLAGLRHQVMDNTFQAFEKDFVIELDINFAVDKAIVAAVVVAAAELVDTARPGHLGKELE